MVIRMKKTVIGVIIALVSGALLAKFTFDTYEAANVNNVISYDNNVYMLKYGTYDSKEEMISSASVFERYVYVYKDGKLTVYLGISKKRENLEKIKDVYESKSVDTSIEQTVVDNDEFIQNLDEYEKLLDVTEDEDSLLMIENQILSCYEDLMVEDE